MNIPILEIIYASLLAGLIYALFQRYKQYQRLKHIPGPRTTGLSWWWHSRAVLSGQCYRYYASATERYGPLARVAPNLLVTSSPELWARINAARSPYARDPWYYHAARFEPGKDNVFTDCDSARHDARRKKMAAGYAGKENPDLEASIDACVQDLIELLRAKYAAPGPHVATPAVDLAAKIPYLTLDVISAVGLGAPFGDLRADADVHGYLAAMGAGLAAGNVAFGLGFAWLRGVPLIGPLISPSETDRTGYGRMMAEARKVVEARKRASVQERSDMIASFIRHGVPDDDLFQEVFEQLLAGSDTTAAAIRIILLFLMTHPRVYATLQAEIDAAVRTGRVSASVIADDAARRLPYLSAVVREGLRVHPPVVNVFARIAPDEGDVVTLDGKDIEIPGGTRIGYAAWSMHRTNTAVYGPDAAVFRPERWLADEKERLAHMTRVNDLIFGHGRWACLGQAVARTELHKAVFELLRHFDLALAHPHAAPWRCADALGLLQITDLWVHVTVRPGRETRA